MPCQKRRPACEAVSRNRTGELTALLHHINIDVLRASFFGLNKSAAPGVDEMTWTDYAEALEANLVDLHARVHTERIERYRRVGDTSQRWTVDSGIAALEDKIVQAAVVAILTPIYKAEFLGFSYGFRPKRQPRERWPQRQRRAGMGRVRLDLQTLLAEVQHM